MPGVSAPARRQLAKQASLFAFLDKPGAPKLTALRLRIRGYESGLSTARVLAALPPLHSVTDLSIEVQWNVVCPGIGPPYTTRDYRVLRGILLACPGLQQLRIHALTSEPYIVTLDPRLWRAMFQDAAGNSCLPQSSLRRLELSAAPGTFRLSLGIDETGFPSLAWLPEFVLRSQWIEVASLAFPVTSLQPDVGCSLESNHHAMPLSS